MGRTVLVAGPLYVDFTTAETQISSAAHQVQLCPEHSDKGWERRLGGSAWKVAAQWRTLAPSDKVILLAKMARPWSENNAAPVLQRPFVDDARWLRDELQRKHAAGGPLDGVVLEVLDAERGGADYTFHLRQSQAVGAQYDHEAQAGPPKDHTDWPAQTIFGGAAHELKWSELYKTAEEHSKRPDGASHHLDLVILCGIARTGILDQVVVQPDNNPLALPSDSGGQRPKLVIDFGRADLRNWSALDDGAQRLQKLRDFLHRADLVFVDEPTANAVALLDPSVMPDESALVVRHTLLGTWWAYRVEAASHPPRLERRPLEPDRNHAANAVTEMEPALAGDRPRRFAALVESWHWSARAPAKAKGGEWQSYRPLTIYRDREDITSHPPLLDLLKSIEHSVKTGASTKLVIQGETGTGKEIIARWVHRLLAERKNCQPHELPIKVISPAGVTKELAQSMLFGHYKGAFTDAHADRKGALELALGGLLLLDDLQEIPLPVQAMLLRALEYGELERMGAQTSYSFAEGNAELDLFLVCTVNRPIRELIEAGKVLQDLWHRLRKDGDYLLLPPLRERREDALRAAEAVWQDLCVKLGNQGSLPDNLRSALQKEQLDGNFRAVHSIVRSHYMVRRQQAAGLSVDVLNEHLAQMLAGIVGNGDAPGPRPGGRRGDDPPVVTWILGNRQRLERERKPIAEDGLNGELAWLAWACRRYCSDHGGRPPIELKRRHFQVLLSRKYSNNRYSDAMKAAADWIQEGNKPAETKYLLKDQAS